MHSPAGVGVASSRDASRRAAARATRHRYVRAWRECWPERRRRWGAEGPTAPGGAGTGAPTAGVAGTSPGPVNRHGWSSTWLVMRMR
jgi:hypothetical protein